MACVAAGESGARPRFVWTRMPVALSTGVREEAEREASEETMAGATSATGISPARAAFCTSEMMALMVAWLRRSPAAMTSGRARR
jgi:hypothetical protein